MSKKDITKIERIKNVRILDLKKNDLFPFQDVLKITFRNGNCRYLDLFDYFDITDNKDYRIIFYDKSKSYVIFEESEEK